MSVVTSYHISSPGLDIATKLKEIGVLVNDDIDLSKACPELWAEDVVELRKHGVRASSVPSIKSILTHNHIAEQIGINDAPEIVNALGTDNRLVRFGIDRDNVYGAYIESKTPSADPDCPFTTKRDFVPFSEENQDKVIAYATHIQSMYKECTDDHIGKFYRRDLTAYEENQLKLVRVYPSNDDDNGIVACINYATTFDDCIPTYVSKALPGIKIHLVQCTECNLDAECDYLDGKVIESN